MAAFRAATIAEIRAQVGKGRVICGLSGGVDSAVAAVLIHEAIGDQLTCVFVDHGLMRKGEAEQVVSAVPRPLQHPAGRMSNAATLFLNALAGVTDPEAKRKIIGKTFIDVFEDEAKKIGGAEFLAQGTLYPDVIESVSFTGGPSVTIKIASQCRRPARADEHEAGRAAARTVQGRGARARAASWGCRTAFVGRHPFPGPGLAIRIPGEVTAETLRHPAQGRRDLSRRDPQGRALRRDLAGVRGAAAGADRRRDGRRPHLRLCRGAARGDLDRRHDRGLLFRST